MADHKLNQIIELTYETVLDSSLWQQVLRLCVRYLKASDSQMVVVDEQSFKSIRNVTAFDNNMGENYVNYYIQIDPRMPIWQNRINEWQTCQQLLSDNYISNSEFFQDFFLPNNYRYTLGGKIQQNKNYFTGLGFYRAPDQHEFQATELEVVKQLTPHFQRALQLQNYTEKLQKKVHLREMAIDALDIAMLIIDNLGKVLHLNLAAEEFIANQKHTLSVKWGKINCEYPYKRNELQSLIISATTSPAIGGAMFLDKNSNIQLFVTPLPETSKIQLQWQTTLALIIIQDGSKTSSLELFEKIYDLSPAEIKLATALNNGKTLEKYAETNSLSINTVRTQLKSIFNKTNTHRQSELISLLSTQPKIRS